MLFDTDVLIWALRGNERAASAIEAPEMRNLSVVTYMELVQGARDKRELAAIRDFLQQLGFQPIPLAETIGHRACVYLEEYALKSGLGMADALVAATAVEANESLCSGNFKHYRVISELRLIQFRP